MGEHFHLTRLSPMRLVLALLLVVGFAGADKSPRSPLDATSAQVQAIAKFATTEIRKLCAHCYWHMKVSYENFELQSVVSAEKGPAAFGKGTNYYLKLELETKGPGYYKGVHDVFIFTGEKDEYKSMAIDEFPQMKKPFLGDRIKLEKQWKSEGKKTIFEAQRESDPSVGDGPGPALRKEGPGHILTATKFTASRGDE